MGMNSWARLRMSLPLKEEKSGFLEGFARRLSII
jgi:hypothetical protein